MTREERIEKLRHLITCMKCEVGGKSCDNNCPTQYYAGNMGEIIENLEEIAKALEQEKDLSISELGLSVRSYHCLIRSGYLSLSDIIGFSYDDIAKIRNVGKKSADEIWQVIEKHRRVKE